MNRRKYVLILFIIFFFFVLFGIFSYISIELGEPPAVRTHSSKDIDSLIQQLKDEQSDSRLRAVRDLGRLKDPRSIEPMIALLKDEDFKVRNQTKSSLINLGSPITEHLIAALKDENILVRRGAINILGKIKDYRAARPLINMLADQNIEIQLEAANALLNLGKSATESLIGALNDENSLIRRGTLYILSEINYDRAKVAIEDALQKECPAFKSRWNEFFNEVNNNKKNKMLQDELEKSKTEIILINQVAKIEWIGEKRTSPTPPYELYHEILNHSIQSSNVVIVEINKDEELELSSLYWELPARVRADNLYKARWIIAIRKLWVNHPTVKWKITTRTESYERPLKIIQWNIEILDTKNKIMSDWSLQGDYARGFALMNNLFKGAGSSPESWEADFCSPPVKEFWRWLGNIKWSEQH